MKEVLFTILSNRQIAEKLWRMELSGDTDAIACSGQFVNITIPGLYLKRPISVSDRGDGSLTLVYKVVGKGTDVMSGMKKGESLSMLTGLGNGFDSNAAGETFLLAGGGVGAAPLYLLAKELLAKGKKVKVVLGFNSGREVILREDFEMLGVEVNVATMDGSVGTKGFVTDVNTGDFDYFFACGPKPMLRAVCNAFRQDGEVSMEERMGCGFGICYGCSIQTSGGAKRVCKDGPVFKKEDMIW